MIKTLSIKNYAIIEDLEIEFSKGLTIITGETGAGKSILLGALGLIMGERADLKVFFDQNEKCVVEGVFDIAKYNLQPFFTENEIEYEGECVVRREIAPSGKSRAFVNDTPVNLDLLRQLSGALIDLHQQFDNLDIHHVSFQLRMLDALAGNGALLARYDELFNAYVSNRKNLEKMLAQSQSQGKEQDYVKYLLEELEAAKLEAGEQNFLEEELQKLSNAEEIKRVLDAASNHLSESETAVSSQLKDLQRSLSGVAKFDPAIAKLCAQLESLTLDLQDISEQFLDMAEDTEFDGARIAEVQQRLDLIYKLQKKHSVQSVEELLAIQGDLEKQLGFAGDLTEEIARLEKEIARQKLEMTEVANQLSARRKSVTPAFEEKIQANLSQLSMNGARLNIQISPLQELTATGLDEVAFLFAANTGSRLQQIKDVASGGELSRLTLVTKSLVASAIPLPTLIFDEIDSGVSGDVAIKMGDILRNLSNKHQVVVITHSPQVASKADAHYFIYKTTADNRTFTKVKLLTNDERIRALAVMLSQNPPSEAALANAKELLRIAETNISN